MESGADRALQLLAAAQEAQRGLPRGAALAWERAAFRAAFLHPEPGHRIRAFLSRSPDRGTRASARSEDPGRSGSSPFEP